MNRAPARSGPVRWFYPCPTCLLPLNRESGPDGPVWPEHFRDVWIEGFSVLDRCPESGKAWTATA